MLWLVNPFQFEITMKFQFACGNLSPMRKMGRGVMAKKDKQVRPVMVRLPEALRRRIEREAKSNGRSMNSEIVRRLEQSLAELQSSFAEPGNKLGKMLAEEQARLAREVEEIKQQIGQKSEDKK